MTKLPSIVVLTLVAASIVAAANLESEEHVLANNTGLNATGVATENPSHVLANSSSSGSFIHESEDCSKVSNLSAASTASANTISFKAIDVRNQTEERGSDAVETMGVDEQAANGSALFENIDATAAARQIPVVDVADGAFAGSSPYAGQFVVVGPWRQCGGINFDYSLYVSNDVTDATTKLDCSAGYTCEVKDKFFFQCRPEPVPPGKVRPWGQCGGRSYRGLTSCAPGFVCEAKNVWYSQCAPEV